jgi:hypothetical protein
MCKLNFSSQRKRNQASEHSEVNWSNGLHTLTCKQDALDPSHSGTTLQITPSETGAVLRNISFIDQSNEMI